MSARKYMDRLGEIPTPFYFYDMDLLRQTLQTVVAASSKYGYRVHYALKANFEEPILQAAKEAGLGADCVSGNEVRAAIEAGIPASEVVFAGVGKSDREIIYALEQDIFSFNCESLQELEVINALAAERGKVARIALRINPDVDPKTHKHITTGKADSKFGISYSEVNRAIASLESLAHLEIVGLHFHIGSQIMDLSVYEQLCDRVNEIQVWFTQQGIELKHLNLGGGVGVNYQDPDGHSIFDFADYFDMIHRKLNVKPGQTVHFELGRSLVAQCGELITRVLYMKENAAGKEIAIVDAGMTDLIRPALYQAYHKIENLTSTGAEKLYTVGGPVCESSDIFAVGISLNETRRGDLLTMRTAGAYGSAMASRYNLRDFPASVTSDELSSGTTR